MIGLGIAMVGCEKLQQKFMDEPRGDEASFVLESIDVSETLKQPIHLGIDAKRLWHWRSYLKDELAQLAVSELHSAYVRVAVNCAYEREEGVINAAAYDNTLEMMNALKTAKPTILFFASPTPLADAYTLEEGETIWGGRGQQKNVPWSPYPAWILEWDSVGTKIVNGVEVTDWQKGDFHIDKLVQYYADYLNFMKSEGFDITYLDLVNEEAVLRPHHAKYIKDNLPVYLDAGVSMPYLIAPSSWSIQQAGNWLAAINSANGEQHGFDIAATHNTGGSGSISQFVSSASNLGKDAWNTELHAWTGGFLRDEVLKSSVFWEHMRAGIVGLNTWLFFGPSGNTGPGHWMVAAHWNNGNILRTGKYEIFKQVVNNANGGNYVEVTSPTEQLVTAAFIKDNILSVWVLNKDTTAITDQSIHLGNRNVLGKDIDAKIWQDGLPNVGSDTTFTATDPYDFTFDIDGESLYFFKIDFN